jgi:DNA processing protein
MNSFIYSEYINKFSEFEKKNAPKNFFFDGDISLLTQGIKVAVVGSRKPSDEGIIRARSITKKLVELGITVVSGLAEGIDTVAHLTTISLNGKTIAFLGTPLNISYPKSNEKLLTIIKSNHLAISQFPYGYPIMKQNFPDRNRTMALFSDATVIVEASENSGTRHQGWEALRLGRSVFIMENVIKNPSVSWAKEMLKYGAQILKKDNLSLVLEEIPSFVSSVDFAF